MRPNSAQRCSVGTALPGLSRPSGVEGLLHAMEGLQFRGRELHAHLVDLLDADAVLAGDGAADCDAQLQDLGAEGLRRSSSPGSLASYRISGCRLPSPAWNTLQQRRPYFCLHAGDGRSTSRQALARDGAVHAVVVGRDAAHRRERGLAPRPEAQALGLVARHADLGGAAAAPSPAACARSPRRPLPACRRIRTAGSLRRPADSRRGRRARRPRVAGLSIISRPAGMMPAAMTSATALPALPTSSNAASTHCASCGFGSSLTVTSVITASMPSEPIISASRS